MKITHSQLVSAGACSEQLEMFDRLFPSGADVTYENAEAAANAGITVTWLISCRKFTNPLWVKACSPLVKEISKRVYAPTETYTGARFSEGANFGLTDEYRAIVDKCIAEYDRETSRLVVDILTGKLKIGDYLDKDGNFKN